jgi:exopolyphosphatase/guanosine-5'-triphosphate,3'-diphosphate pyrophosphatase
VIDLGGGSAQVTEVRGGLPRRSVSMPLGALRLTELFLNSPKVTPEQVEALRGFTREQLQPQDWFRARAGDALVAIGGTIRNLAQIDQAQRLYPLDTVQGYPLSADSLYDISERLWRLSLKKRVGVKGLRLDRADIIHAGALAYSEMLRYSGFSTITITRQGLREGLFYERFLADQAQPIIKDLRRFSVENLARNFNNYDDHTQHVAFLALRMFDQLHTAHQLDDNYRELLWAAGMLHDIGTVVNYQYHHLHSYYIVLNHALPGYSPRELAFTALLCRYHRSKGRPRPKELASLLNEGDADALVALVGILRLAEFFERGRRQVIRDVRCHLDLEHGWLQIEALADGDAAMEMWEAGRNLDVLAQALGLEVELVEGMWLEKSDLH